MRRSIACIVFVLVVLTAPAALADAPHSLERITRTFTGDLSELLKERRPIRVLVSYNRTNFFMYKGEARGLEADYMRAYEKHLLKVRPKAHPRMVFVAVPFDELLPALLDGRGDIAAAGLTVTDKRRRTVAFSMPYRTDVRELIVGGPKSDPIRSMADLAGKTVHVMAGSSYAEHLSRLNNKLEAEGLKPAKVVEANPNLVTEDLLEMVHKGLFRYTVADSYMVEIWQKVMPDLKSYGAVPVNTGGSLAWAVRPGSVELLKSVNEFVRTARQGTLLGNMFFKRYYQNTEWVENPFKSIEQIKMSDMANLFQKYAQKYEFDWLKIAAQAFQESRFNQKLKSSQGAVGVMQIKPSTAADPNIAIRDVYTLDNNIHAGVKYLRFLLNTYFLDVDPEARVDFALAAYNAGPGRVRGLQKKAEKMGLDPKKWFGNVEWAAYDAIGKETPNYVAHVQMYYAAYKASAEVLLKREDAL